MGAICLLELDGYWDARRYDTFLQISVEIVNLKAYQVVVDCAELIDIEAAALEGLVQLLQLAIARGGELVLVEVPEKLKKRLDSIGLFDSLQTFSSLREAVDYFSAQRWL